MRRTEFFRTTWFRLGVAMAGVLVIGILALGGFVFWYIAADLRAPAEFSVRNEISTIVNGPRDLPPGVNMTRLNLQGEIERHLHFDPRHVKVIGLFSPSHQLLAGNLAEWPVPFNTTREFDLVTVVRIDERGRETHHALVSSHEFPDGRRLIVGRNIDDFLELRGKVARALLIGLSPAVALCILGGVVLGLRTQKRLTELRRAARRIIAGHLVERLPARGRGDDLDQLAEIVNSMLDEISKLMNDIRGIGEDIAHDLRTPLTRVRTRLERGRDQAKSRDELAETVDKAIAGIDQTLAIVTALLRIAEIEHDRRCAAFAPVDLAEIVQAAAELYEPIADDKGLSLETRIETRACVQGDKDLLMDAVANLVDNAVKFTAAPGKVVIELVMAPRGAAIRVRDNGPGIAANDRENVLRRFYRSDKSRNSPGIGLGLNLVAAIVQQHGFQLAIGDADPGCIIEIICIGAEAMPAGSAAPSRPREVAGSDAS